MKSPIDILIEKGYEDVIVFANPDYTDALIGLTDDYNAVYDFDLMVEWLINHDDMTAEDAADFISYNSSYCYGEHYPVIYYETFEDEEDDEEKLIFTKLEDLQDYVKD